MAKTQAVSYVRVSSRGQVTGDGPERQRRAIATFVKARGLELIGEYFEAGITGTADLDDRPALASVLDRVASNGVKTVLVEHADRLARDLMVSEVILSQFRKVGARVLTTDGQDLTVADDDPTRRLIRQVLGAVSEFEKAVLVGKLRGARKRQRASDGYCEGRKPYGWREGGLDDEEQLVLARMRALRRKPAKGQQRSFQQIAETLNAADTFNREGRPWSASRVHAVLRRAETIERTAKR